MISCVLSVADVDASLKFYSRMLDLEPGERLPGPDGKTRFASLHQSDASQIMLTADAPKGAAGNSDARGQWFELYLSLGVDDDIDGYYFRMEGYNVPILEPIEDKSWGERTFVITDPDGYQIRLAKSIHESNSAEMTAITSDTQN